MNLHLLHRGYSVQHKDMPILSEWMENHALAKCYGVLPSQVSLLMNDVEYDKSLAIIRAENEAVKK